MYHVYYKPENSHTESEARHFDELKPALLHWFENIDKLYHNGNGYSKLSGDNGEELKWIEGTEGAYFSHYNLGLDDLVFLSEEENSTITPQQILSFLLEE